MVAGVLTTVALLPQVPGGRDARNEIRLCLSEHGSMMHDWVVQHRGDDLAVPREAVSPLNAILFGGCMLRQPLRVMATRQRGLADQKYGSPSAKHTFGEMFQFIEVLRGARKIPRELMSLCRIPPRLGPVAGAEDFRDLDVALIEPASPVELNFRGFAINRIGMMKMLAPIEAQGREAAKLSAVWLRIGLTGLKEDVRAAAAEKLLGHVHGDTPQADLTRAVISETRAFKSNITDGFRQMQESLGCPIGAVIYVFRYLPDGRPISWPASFRKEVVAAAQELNLPIFDPAPLVAEHGVQGALAKDSSHYSARFLPVIGRALMAFAREVHRGRPLRLLDETNRAGG
jgi:hypothetical protein